ncbi:unnamed protein product [Arctia plantaginis]|uniref:Uncharacterized protein n=1 Tax=Arctia plantaginis TaxID=874455 RepID=A0A8S1ASW3_ARCPL|nr:unnamed protein product [Arctia plantaginis]
MAVRHSGAGKTGRRRRVRAADGARARRARGGALRKRGSSGRRREECGRPSDAERPSPYASRILRPRIPKAVAASTFQHLAPPILTLTNL